MDEIVSSVLDFIFACFEPIFSFIFDFFFDFVDKFYDIGVKVYNRFSGSVNGLIYNGNFVYLFLGAIVGVMLFKIIIVIIANVIRG